MSDAILTAVVSDIHANSSVAVCTPEGVELDDGQTVLPSRAQLWLNQCWQDYWDGIAQVREAYDAELQIVINGDLVEGDHHGSPQVMSLQAGTEKAIARRVLEYPKSLGPTRWFVVRGTETHVGKQGKAEESLAEWLGAVPHPVLDTSSWWHLRMQVQGVRLDFTHHGRTGYRSWTRANASSLLAADIFMIYAKEAAFEERSSEYPHIAFRSHFHKYGDSGSAHPTRVIQTGAFQLHTAHTHKKHAEDLADIGGSAVLVRDGSVAWVPGKEKPFVHLPERDPVWRHGSS